MAETITLKEKEALAEGLLERVEAVKAAIVSALDNAHKLTVTLEVPVVGSNIGKYVSQIMHVDCVLDKDVIDAIQRREDGKFSISSDDCIDMSAIPEGYSFTPSEVKILRVQNQINEYTFGNEDLIRLASDIGRDGMILLHGLALLQQITFTVLGERHLLSGVHYDGIGFSMVNRASSIAVIIHREIDDDIRLIGKNLQAENISFEVYRWFDFLCRDKYESLLQEVIARFFKDENRELWSVVLQYLDADMRAYLSRYSEKISSQ